MFEMMSSFSVNILSTEVEEDSGSTTENPVSANENTPSESQSNEKEDLPPVQEEEKEEPKQKQLSKKLPPPKKTGTTPQKQRPTPPPSSFAQSPPDDPNKISDVASTKFILVRVGPPESFSKTNLDLLKYSIGYPQFAKAQFYHSKVIEQYTVIFFAKDLKCAHIARENGKYYHNQQTYYSYSINNEEITQKIRSLNILWTQENKLQYNFILDLCSTHLPQIRLNMPNITNDEKLLLEKEVEKDKNQYRNSSSSSSSSSSNASNMNASNGSSDNMSNMFFEEKKKSMKESSVGASFELNLDEDAVVPPGGQNQGFKTTPKGTRIS